MPGFRSWRPKPADIQLKQSSPYHATENLIRNCLESNESRFKSAKTSPRLSQTDSWTVFDTLFVFLLYEVVVSWVVDILRSKQDNKRFIIRSISMTILHLPPLALFSYIWLLITVLPNVKLMALLNDAWTSGEVLHVLHYVSLLSLFLLRHGFSL